MAFDDDDADDDLLSFELGQQLEQLVAAAAAEFELEFEFEFEVEVEFTGSETQWAWREERSR